MLLVIISQKGRLLEEIVFDNQNNVSNAVNLSKREKFWKRVFIGYYALICVTYVIVILWFMLAKTKTHDSDSDYRVYFTICGSLGGLTYLLMVFHTLQWNMWRYHRYEFKKNRCHMYGLYLIMVACNIVILIYLVFDRLDWTNVLDSIFFETKNYRELYYYYQNTTSVHYYYNLVIYVAIRCGLQVILMAWVLLYFKKPEDLLQGISKLDYLLKISTFQIYKTHQNGFSILTDNVSSFSVKYRND